MWLIIFKLFWFLWWCPTAFIFINQRTIIFLTRRGNTTLLSHNWLWYLWVWHWWNIPKLSFVLTFCCLTLKINLYIITMAKIVIRLHLDNLLVFRITFKTLDKVFIRRQATNIILLFPGRPTNYLLFSAIFVNHLTFMINDSPTMSTFGQL